MLILQCQYIFHMRWLAAIQHRIFSVFWKSQLSLMLKIRLHKIHNIQKKPYFLVRMELEVYWNYLTFLYRQNIPTKILEEKWLIKKYVSNNFNVSNRKMLKMFGYMNKNKISRVANSKQRLWRQSRSK